MLNREQLVALLVGAFILASFLLGSCYLINLHSEREDEIKAPQKLKEEPARIEACKTIENDNQKSYCIRGD